MLKTIAGFILIILGIADGWKYTIQALKIQRLGIAKGQSRMFINLAWLVDLGKIACGIVVAEPWLVITTLIGFICVMHLFVITYLFYPYKGRGLCHFHRPNLLIYLINSWMPNKYRKRL